MKKILITGANSYIGTSFENYIKEHYSNEYIVDTVDMIDGSWRDKNFSEYDSVFHVAGIAHQKETKENSHLYYEINRDLAVETAKKAKADGVKQFVFLSSMSVYGLDVGVITKETKPEPKSNYGKSKLQAEDGINLLVDDSFKVCIIRPPMVYGKNCKGNFQAVCKLVRKSPVFPKIGNERSLIYIDNLCSFVRFCIEKNLDGLYFPQNKEYVNTSYMAKVIADTIGKKVIISGLVGLGVCVLRPFVGMVKKAFGTLVYENTEEFNFDYCVVDNKDSFRLSVE